jgi:hypothetical protein
VTESSEPSTVLFHCSVAYMFESLVRLAASKCILVPDSGTSHPPLSNATMESGMTQHPNSHTHEEGQGVLVLSVREAIVRSLMRTLIPLVVQVPFTTVLPSWFFFFCARAGH